MHAIKYSISEMLQSQHCFLSPRFLLLFCNRNYTLIFLLMFNKLPEAEMYHLFCYFMENTNSPCLLCASEGEEMTVYFIECSSLHGLNQVGKQEL